MANQSIYNAFERMWTHILSNLDRKAESFIVNITEESDGSYTADKTFNEINEAANARKIMYALVSGVITFNFIGYSTSTYQFMFGSIWPQGGVKLLLIGADNSITIGNGNPTPINQGGTGSNTAAGALANLGLTATATELNTLDGITATTTELNYCDGVTSNIQTQLNGKLPLTGGTINGNLTTTGLLSSSGDTSLRFPIGAGNSTTAPYVALRKAGNSGSYTLCLVYYDANGNVTYNNLINADGSRTWALNNHNHDSTYLKLSGGTVNGSITATTLQLGSSNLNGGLELYHATPFIDFHFGRSTADYTSRIIETASGTLSMVVNHVRAGNTGNSDYKTIYVQNSLHAGGLHTSAAGNLGVFSEKHNKWIIRMDSSGLIFVPTDFGCSTDIYAVDSVCVGGIQSGEASASFSSDWIDTAIDTMTITEGQNEGIIVGKAILGPYTTKTYNLGNSNYRWKQLYATTTTINTSDRNLKKDFKTFDSDNRYAQFFMDLKPMIFKMKDGESGRDHFGFVAQDVEDSLLSLGFTSLDFAGLCKDVKGKQQERPKTKEERRKMNFHIQEQLEPELDENGNIQYEYSLRYQEFISLNTYMIQKNVNEINLLKEENQLLKQELQEIKNLLNGKL